MATANMVPQEKTWRPPTPQSILTALPPPPLPSAAFEPLPPPASTLDRSPSTDYSGGEDPRPHPHRSQSLARLLNADERWDNRRGEDVVAATFERATPATLNPMNSNAVGPVLGYFDGEAEALRPAAEINSELLDTPTSLLPTPQGEEEDDEDDEDFDPDYIAPRKRPRREAASEAAKRIPRQPSPFELQSPPRSGGGGQSNRKVSHSLIERRRRERINDCLGHLKQLVPQCREEGEKKVARAKERGRKRGRKGEDGAEEGRGGLHKLEILQGTIVYIEELQTRINSLEAALASGGSINPFPITSRTASPAPRRLPPISSLSSTSTSTASSSTLTRDRDSLSVAVADDADAAALLLKFSTSPELRPVIF